MRTGYDAVASKAGGIPADAEVVMGYVPPSWFAWSDADWGRFTRAAKVRITTSAGIWGPDVHVLDVESGAASASSAPLWAQRTRGAGGTPTVYCSLAVWAEVQRCFTAAGVPQPLYWVASWPGGGATLPSLGGITAVAHQYAGEGAYDLSVVADYWPGVDAKEETMDANDVWMAPCEAHWSAGSKEALLAERSGLRPGPDGKVTEVHAAVDWLTVLCGRLAVLVEAAAPLNISNVATASAAPQQTATASSGALAPVPLALTQYRKAVAALGGGAVPAVTAGVLSANGLTLSPTLVGVLSAVAAVLAVLLAPANTKPLGVGGLPAAPGVPAQANPWAEGTNEPAPPPPPW